MGKHAVKASDDSLNFYENNSFYIYGGIDETLPKNIIVPFINAVQKQKGKVEKGELHIYISSSGGMVQYGLDLIAHIEDAIKNEITVNTYVTSTACSCASLIAVTGSVRYVAPRAYHLLHFARGWEYVHNPVMAERNLENWIFMQDQIVAHYKKYTKLKGIPAKLLADNFMINGAADLIKNGLADYEM